MLHSRAGYTLTEMVTVMVMVAVLTALTAPKLHGVTSSAGLHAARQQTAVYMAQARAVAVQRGREARFVRAGNVIKVTVDSSGTQVIVAAAYDLYREHGVTLSASRDSIQFDPRGFAIGLSSTEQVHLTRAGLRDSVCVTKFGKLIPQGCSL